jgi:hypothetical protein
MGFVFGRYRQLELVCVNKLKSIVLVNISGVRKGMERLPSRGVGQLSLVRVELSALQALFPIKSKYYLIIFLSAFLGGGSCLVLSSRLFGSFDV